MYVCVCVSVCVCVCVSFFPPPPPPHYGDRPEQKDKIKKKRIRDTKEGNEGTMKKRDDEGVEDEAEGEWEVVKRRSTFFGELSDKEKMRILFGKEKVEVEVSVVAKKRNQLVELKGKKGTDRGDQVRMLQYLVDISNNAGLGEVD